MTKGMRFLALSLSLLWTFQIHAFTDVDAKNLVNDFYQSLAELSSSNIYQDHLGTDKSIDLNKKLSRMVLDYKDNFCAPNEERIFDDSSISSGGIYFKSFVEDYSEYARMYNTVTVNYEITNCESVSHISREKDISTHSYYYLQVRREVKAKDTTWHLWDLVCVDGNAGKIVGIGNKTFGGYSPDEYNQNDYNKLMADAAWANKRGNYDKAYDCYQQASWLKPAMCEPFYRMALMIYFKKGVKGRFKNAKERREMLKKYLYNAQTWRGESNYYQFHRDASNLEYIITNGMV